MGQNHHTHLDQEGLESQMVIEIGMENGEVENEASNDHINIK